MVVGDWHLLEAGVAGLWRKSAVPKLDRKSYPRISVTMKMLVQMALALTACGALGACGQKAATASSADQSLSALTPAGVCASPIVTNEIRSIVFENAEKIAPDSTKLALSELGRRSSSTVQLAVLDSYDAQTKKVICSGTLHLTLPVGAVKNLTDQEVVKEIHYTAQPAADGNGWVVAVQGAENVITGLAFADIADWATKVVSPPPVAPVPLATTSLATSNTTDADIPPVQVPHVASGPSFDCAKARSYAEKTICSDGELSAKDRNLAVLYEAALARDTSGAVKARAPQEWRRRETCTDRQCIIDWYRQRESDLTVN